MATAAAAVAATAKDTSSSPFLPASASTSPFLPSHTTATTTKCNSKETPGSNTTTRRCRVTSTTILLISTAAIVLTAGVLTLALVFLKQRNPTLTLVSVSLTSLSPSVSLTPGGSLLVNATLRLDLLLHNPNLPSFHHSTGSSGLFYRGSRVGAADVAPGTVPGKGAEHARCSVTVEPEGLSKVMGDVVKDVQNGELRFDSRSRVQGTVTILGFIRRKLSAEVFCDLVVGLGPVRVAGHHCFPAFVGT